MENGSVSRETHFNKTKQETHFRVIMPNFINMLSKGRPLWKGSYDGYVLEETIPRISSWCLCRWFQGIYSDHLLVTNFSQVSLSPSTEIWPVTCKFPTHFLLPSFPENMGIKDLCLLWHLFNSMGWDQDGSPHSMFLLGKWSLIALLESLDHSPSPPFLTFYFLNCLLLSPSPHFSLYLLLDSMALYLPPSLHFSHLLSHCLSSSVQAEKNWSRVKTNGFVSIM